MPHQALHEVHDVVLRQERSLDVELGEFGLPVGALYSSTKGAVETLTRAWAAEFGPLGIRVNAISSGPIRTLAGAGIGDARSMFAFQQRHSPLHRGVTLDELGGAGVYLLSDLSTVVTGEVHFVDSGYNVIAMPHPDALRADAKQGTEDAAK